MKPGKKITVWWTDSCGLGRYWVHPDEIDHRPDRIVTRGFVVKDSKRSMTVASSMSHDQVGGSITIPKFAIRKMKKS